VTKIHINNMFFIVQVYFMIRKFLIYIIFLTSLNGCVQGIAFLGPVFSYSQSGNVMQSALSYGSNQVFQKVKNKTNEKNNKDNALDDNRSSSLLKKK